MFFRRALIPVVMVLTLLVQFMPGTALGPQPAAAALCDAAQFVADVTIPDGTTLAPGASFVKTWRLMNNGTCTWSTSYAVVFASGDQMGSPAVIPMPSSVAPGGTVDITVNMTAPSTLGHYRGNFKLRNASGGLFGVGTNAAFLFWVDINVSVSYSVAYDFVANACSATWSSGAGTLPCPGTDGDVKGFVLKSSNPQLENGTTSSAAGLIVNPQQVTSGFIQGVYPAFTVQAGDRFQSIVNCAYNATHCYVNFRLAYQIGSGPVTTFWTFNERFEGLFFRANVDLTPLAGQSVKFILYVADVSGHGLPSGDRAEWVDTKIARGGSGGVPIPPTTVCDRGAFVGDVTIPDGSVLAPGQAFTKTWRIRNVGSCTWTTSYALVFVFGNTFGAAPAINLSSSVAPVAPGQTADFSINMVAPTTPGHYRSYWRFRNASGVQFGVGSGLITFFADINVSATAPTPTTGGPATPTATAVISGPNADLVVTKNDGITTYTPGGTTTYTITVKNNGPNDVVGATFTDNKPSPHVTSWTVTCAADSGASCTTGPILPPGGILDIVNIPAGKKIVYTVVATISASAVGNLVNTASITNPAAVPDPNLANNSATDTDAPPSADLSVTKTDNVTFYPLGGTVTYTIQLANAGPLGVTGATFTDPKPTQVTGWVWSCTTAGGAVWSGPGTSTGNVSATVNMPASSTITCSVIASISSAAVGDLVNTATITPPAGVLDGVLSNNSATHTDTGPSADMAVTKSDGVSSYTPGGTLTYTIDVINNGPLIVTDAQFLDNIPSQFTQWAWTCVPDTGASCALGPVTVTDAANRVDKVTIPAGNKVRYTVVATVNAAATGNIVNTASIAPALVNPMPDPNPGNNSATDTDVPPTADLSVTKSDGLTYYTPGGAVNYTIDVRNNGPQAVTGAQFSDAMPANITAWTWTCTPDAGASCLIGTSNAAPFTDLVNIPSGAKVRYSVAATINTITSGNIENSATIMVPTGITDPNPANDTSTDIDLHPVADLAVLISDQVTTYTPGGQVIYTVTVTNNGPSNVVNAPFTATKPAIIDNWTWTCLAQVGASCTSEGISNPGDFTDLALSIPAGRSVVYTAVANINAAATGALTVTVTISAPTTAPLDVPDPTPGNNTATDVDIPV
jgi:uncharacterized repeat protein (TIGR01451 family)